MAIKLLKIEGEKKIVAMKLSKVGGERERERERRSGYCNVKKNILPKSMQNSYIDSFSKKQKEIHRFLFLSYKTYCAQHGYHTT